MSAAEGSNISSVLFVVEALARGGTEESIRRIAAELVRRGIHCTVAHLFPPATLAAEIEAAGAGVVWLGARGLGGIPTALVRLVRLERRLRPDVVHSHLFLAGVATAATGLMPGAAPRLLTLHSIDYFDPSERWQRRARRAAHRFALRRQRLLAVSEDVAGHFADEFALAERPGIVANPVIEAPRREGPGADGLIVCPARLVPPKRHDRLIDALAAIIAAEPGARLVLAGEGPARPMIEQRVRDLGLQDSVELRGEVDQQSVIALLREARVVAMASDYEGFGMGVADAMALGVPVVVTRVPGLREVVAGRAAGGGVSAGAIAVERDDVEGFGAALVRALDAERSVAMGRAARDDALGRFGPSAVADELLARYAEEISRVR